MLTRALASSNLPKPDHDISSCPKEAANDKESMRHYRLSIFMSRDVRLFPSTPVERRAHLAHLAQQIRESDVFN